MNTESTDYGKAVPLDVYARCLEKLETKRVASQRREKALGFIKLLIALAMGIAALMLLRRPQALSLLALPASAFLVLTVMQEKLLRSLRYNSRAISCYKRGLARLTGEWASTGEAGDRFLDPVHPYTKDLDIFGRGSLFELLCTARTRAGEETLAAWLQIAAPVEEVVSRQHAVRELEDRVDLRERLFSLGETLRLGLRPEELTSCGELDRHVGLGSIPLVTGVLASLWVASLASWALWNANVFFFSVTTVCLAYYFKINGRLEEAAHPVEKACEDLKLFAELLKLIERESFSSQRLQALQALLSRRGITPLKAIQQLAKVVNLLESRRNMFARSLDLVTFWSVRVVLITERWRRQFGPEIRSWILAAGEFEAFLALSAFAYEHPTSVMPEFTSEGAVFEAEAMAHPLLPLQGAVSNDVQLGSAPQLMILSGTNMSGKSTFLRSIGVNAVLAQCGASVYAKRLRMSPLNVAASISIQDSLAGGTSRFYAEILRVKLISDLAKGSVPVLFLLDELLSGTNSHDRLAGTEYIVRSLLAAGAIGVVSTHDLALTQMTDTLEGKALNFHFDDQLGAGELVFDYKLILGIVATSNALALMRSIGLQIQGWQGRGL